MSVTPEDYEMYIELILTPEGHGYEYEVYLVHQLQRIEDTFDDDDWERRWNEPRLRQDQ